MKKKIVIDGRQLCGSVKGGVQRFLAEMLAELDHLPERKNDYVLLIPKKAEIEVSYQNIPTIRFGRLKGLLWEQVSLPFYLLVHRQVGLFACTIAPLLYPHGLTVLHDIMLKTCPDLRDSFSSKVALAMLLLNYRIAAKHSMKVGTVSQYSKEDIHRVYHRPNEDIVIAGNAWQHIQRIQADPDWEAAFPQLKKGEFYFALSAARKQKNFKWIYEMAKRNPQSVFAIAGCQEEWQKNDGMEADNLFHLGFICDEQVKALLSNCKAFLFPSYYEGFGIPPMEALACGTDVIIARSTCLPEIYGDSAHYIDPFSYDVDLEMLLAQPVAPAEKVLERYSWKKTAQILDEALSEISG